MRGLCSNLRRRMAILFSAVCFLVAWSALIPAWAGATAPAARPAGNDFLRVIKIDPSIQRLDLAVRLYVPKSGSGPTVSLVSAIHVADRSCYELVQTFLDSQDLVLYEGVGSPDYLRADADPVEKTESAMRTVAIGLERHRLRTKAYPPTLAALLEGRTARQARAVRAAMTDGWGRPLHYQLAGEAFSLRSLGSDGKPGGTGAAADLDFKDQPPLDAKEIQPSKGIQAELADALGLVFQLDAIDTAGPNFRNSDITMEQLQQALRGGPGASTRGGASTKPAGAGGLVAPSGEQVLQMLKGEGAMMAIAKIGLALIRLQPKMKELMRLMIMETVSGDLSNLGALAPGLGPLMDVLVRDRNEVVLATLKKALAQRPAPQSIAIYFGAGHMLGLQERIVSELGYRPAGVFWIPAFEADLSKAGMTPEQLKSMQETIQKMMGRPKAAK